MQEACSSHDCNGKSASPSTAATVVVANGTTDVITVEEKVFEGVAVLPTTSLLTQPTAVRGQHCLNFGSEGEKPHHGSTSTTFSIGSTLSISTSTSERGGDSSASSSGVATMSSTDHLPSLYPVLESVPCDILPPMTDSSSSSSNPSPTLVPHQVLVLDAKHNLETHFNSPNTNVVAPVAAAIMPSSPRDGAGTLELPGCSARSTSRASSGKNTPPFTSPLPPVSPQPPLSMFSAESARDMICVPLRTIVSQNRRRFQSDGFNLDLTYITDRIIAMGYPADTAESLYRNSMKHIVKFLEKFHPDKYKVFNLRGQYAYNEKNFHYRVVSYEMKDHHPPRLELMAPFCREVHEHLQSEPTNVVAVHCKAGKGRTGVMICAYLYYIHFFENPRQIMDYYSVVRTHNNKGVTIPSQRRYVYYFAHLRDKKLNYIPLKTELLGVYLEKPPRTGGILRKGSLMLRVANGDADVFHGMNLSLTSEQYDDEEDVWKKNPVAVGEDTYDPRNPESGKNCVSRRCYGWTVPPHKRVFLEGDIRVDITRSSHIKPIKLLSGKADKIGHVWFNTMFTCPSFCGGAYVHGDEAYPYLDEGTTIVSKKLSKSQEELDTSDITLKSCCTSEKSLPKHMTTSASVPSSPPCHKLHSNSIATKSSPHDSENDPSSSSADSSKKNTKAPLIGHRKSSKNALRLNGVAKKLAEALESKKPPRYADRSVAAQEAKCERWSSQDGGIVHRSGLVDATKPSRASLDLIGDCADHSSVDYSEIVVRRPPGLDAHCPQEVLKDIYPNGNAPRYNIEDMLRNAYKKNLIRDAYNARRLSAPTQGNVMPKAEVPKTRPEVGGPFCLMRQAHEHVMTYPVMEIDRAYKCKEIDTGFKIHIVTRCVDMNNPAEAAVAEKFIDVTRKKQADKDARKRDNMKGKKYAEEARRYKVEKQFSGMSSSDSDSNDEVPPAENPKQLFKKDPRFTDPHLRKYFFRQRITSDSRHPNHNHRCELLQTTQKTDRPCCYENNDAPEQLPSGASLGVSELPPAIHGRCATISAGNADGPRALEANAGKQTQRSRSARMANVEKTVKKQSMASTGSEPSPPGEDSHPTDCSWASSSTSSSSPSFEDEHNANSSDSDCATLRRLTGNLSTDG